jgi:antitoxin YefM
VTYTDLRRNLVRYLDEVVEGRVLIVMARPRGKGNVVLLAKEEYNSWQETMYLLRNPGNAGRLLRSMRDADEGHLEEHELIRPGPDSKS